MIRPSTFAAIFLAGLTAVAPFDAGAQDLPDALKDKALAVRVHATVPASAETVAWQGESTRYTVPGTPVGVKIVGTNVVILVQVTPFDRAGQGLTLVTQGQVWVRRGDGGLSYRTTLNTVAVNYGEIVLFYPLGVTPDGKAPLRIEIAVMRAAELPGQAQPAGAASGPASGVAK